MDFEMMEYQYKAYLENVSKNQTDIIRYATECVCLESNDMLGIMVLNESMMDSIMKAVKGIIAAIKGMWKKFAERMNEVLTTDIAFLEKYKNIMKKPPVSREITMYKYNVDALRTVEVPKFVYDQKMQNWLRSEDAGNTFTSTFMNTSNIKAETSEDITDAVKTHLRGGEDEETIDGKSLDIQKMYIFVTEYKKIIDAITKNNETINKSEADLSKVLSTIKPVEKKKDETVKENTVFSNVYNSYISESKVKIGKASDTASDSGVSTTSTIDSTTSAKIASDMSSGVGKSEDELKAINDNASTFFKCCGSIMAAHLTIAQEAQKNYMAILRQHVRDHVADAE